MYLKNISRTIVIVGTLLIWVIKFFIRPFVSIPYNLQPLIDIAPNLIGSILLPFGACWFFTRVFRLQTTHQLRITCIFGFLLVVCNEFLQLIPVFGRTFDILDISFSVVGVIIGYFSFAKLMIKSEQWRAYP